MRTKIQTLVQFVSVSLATLALGACGATSHQVVNQPPAINFAQKPYAVEYGTIAVQNITLFYWPDQNEDQLEVTVRTVKTAGDRLDAYAKQKITFAQLAGGFAKLQCLQNFAEGVQDLPGSPIPMVTKWKALPALVVIQAVPEGDPNYPAYQQYLKDLAAHQLLATCQDTQGKWLPIYQWLATKGAQEKTEAEEAIAKAIDPVAPGADGPNMLSATAEGTTISIAPSAQGPKVDVVIKDFLMKGYSPSTQVIDTPKGKFQTIQSAMFLSDRRLLVFGVVELNAQMQPTGRHFEIKMERGPDFMGMARFSGEITLVAADKTVLRTGSISITGILTPASN